MAVTPERVYMTVLRLDEAVYDKHPAIPQHTPWMPMGGENIVLPNDYYRWAESADPASVDEFWDAIDASNWKHAARISGLKERVIAEIMTAAKAGGRNRGRATPENKYVLGIPLTRFLFLVRIEASAQHARVFLRHINRKSGPPFHALNTKQRAAYEWLAERINQEVQR